MDRSKRTRAASFLSLLIVSAAACGGLVDDGVDDRVRMSPTEESRPDAASPSRLASEPAYAPAEKMDCPDTSPLDDEWCPLPLSCNYTDTCSQRPATVSATRSYECTGSRWTRVSAHYPVACPKDLPAQGDPCEPACGYGLPCGYAGSCGALSARCEPRSATWHVTGKTCAQSDGGTDSSTD